MYTITKIILGPILLAQANWLKKTAIRLPEAEGRRSGTEGEPSWPILKVLIVGDSSAAGVGVDSQSDAFAQPMAKYLSEMSGFQVEWKLLAKTGVNSTDALALVSSEHIDGADILITAIGTNDVTSQISSARYIRNLNELSDSLKKRAGIRNFVYTGLPPLHILPAAPQPLRWYLGRWARRLDSDLRKWVNSDSQARYCSLQWAAVPHEMALDKFHPGPGQYKKWAYMVAEIIHNDFCKTRNQGIPENYVSKIA